MSAFEFAPRYRGDVVPAYLVAWVFYKVLSRKAESVPGAAHPAGPILNVHVGPSRSLRLALGWLFMVAFSSIVLFPPWRRSSGSIVYNWFGDPPYYGIKVDQGLLTLQLACLFLFGTVSWFLIPALTRRVLKCESCGFPVRRTSGRCWRCGNVTSRSLLGYSAPTFTGPRQPILGCDVVMGDGAKAESVEAQEGATRVTRRRWNPKHFGWEFASELVSIITGAAAAFVVTIGVAHFVDIPAGLLEVLPSAVFLLLMGLLLRLIVTAFASTLYVCYACGEAIMSRQVSKCPSCNAILAD